MGSFASLGIIEGRGSPILMLFPWDYAIRYAAIGSELTFGKQDDELVI